MKNEPVWPPKARASSSPVSKPDFNNCTFDKDDLEDDEPREVNTLPPRSDLANTAYFSIINTSLVQSTLDSDEEINGNIADYVNKAYSFLEKAVKIIQKKNAPSSLGSSASINKSSNFFFKFIY